MIDFTINGTKYVIKVVSEAIINNRIKNDTCLGLTDWHTQEILLKEGQPNIIKTLKHELTHVWLYEYGHNQDQKEFNAEDVCEIVASINDFINDIVNKYKYFKGFGTNKEDANPSETNNKVDK